MRVLHHKESHGGVAVPLVSDTSQVSAFLRDVFARTALDNNDSGRGEGQIFLEFLERFLRFAIVVRWIREYEGVWRSR